MKKIIYLLFAVLFSGFLSSCVWTEPYEEWELDSDLILKSGTFSSADGDVYIQANLKTWLSVASKSGEQIQTVVWKVEGSTFNGPEIVYQTSTLGEIPFEVEVYFTGTSEKRTFKVISVLDLNEVDPVRCFIMNYNGTKGDITILLSKERASEATENEFFYNGSVSNWILKKIPEADYNYIVVDGAPEQRNNDGQYIAVKLQLEVGEHSIALVYGDNIWANLSGSKFIRKAENKGLAHFYFDGTKIVSLGDEQYLYPGKSGDMYFRFSNNGNGTATFFFKFNEEVTTNSFVTKRNADGTYSAPIVATKVDDFPEWGSYNVSLSSISGDIVYFRYGANKNTPTVYSANMKISSFYNAVYDALQLSVTEI